MEPWATCMLHYPSSQLKHRKAFETVSADLQALHQPEISMPMLHAGEMQIVFVQYIPLQASQKLRMVRYTTGTTTESYASKIELYPTPFS